MPFTNVSDARPAAAILLVLSLAGCGSSGRAGSAADGAGLPPWQGRYMELFDDNIDAAAVGLSMTADAPSPRSDHHLRERAQTADLVARLKVSTVTVDSIGDDSTYHLGVQVTPPPLVKPRIRDERVELVIRSSSRAYAIAKAFDARLQGRTFIGFVHRFAGDDGEPVLHFHLSPDTAEVAAAVKEAVTLGELSGS